jgi:hypothetical protein
MPEPKESGRPASIDPAVLAEILQTLGRGVPITLQQALTQPVDTFAELARRAAVAVPFPPCADTLLGLIRTTGVAASAKDEVTRDFDDYFRFGAPPPLLDNTVLKAELDGELFNCLTRAGGTWPSVGCQPHSCVRLSGQRDRGINTDPETSIVRLFIADLIWLYFYERMGIFQILGVILDDFACRGQLPISNGSLEAGPRDDLAALVLETMVRQTKTGSSSTVRDRACSYRRVLGWTTDAARKLEIESQVSTGFSTLFHKFIYHALEFYRDRRLAVAIRGSAAPAPPSVATLITIGETIRVLKKQFETFDYGRNYENALSGIVWTIAGMSVIREIRTTLGIPPAFDRPHEYIPAAYDLLVLKRPVTTTESNRYSLHRDCAVNGRDIVLDLEALKDEAADFTAEGRELERWLNQAESRIEGYRTAYLNLTGTDLGKANASPDQQA